MKIKLFGSIREKAGKDELEMQAHELGSLKQQLEKEYPFLKEQSYSLAVNKQILNEPSHRLNDADELALLPPFSGG